MQRVVVITGDVNASSKMSEDHARQLEKFLKKCYEDLDVALPDAKVDSFTNFRGDSWQFVVKDPVFAIRTALLYRCYLLVKGDLAFNNRLHSSVALGFGDIQFLPNEKSQAGGGEAYTLSGKKLDKLRRRMPGMGMAGLGEQDQYMDCLLGIIDALIRRWTALQAKAVSLALLGYSQVEIAHLWAPVISQQAVNKHLKAAGWPAVEPALRWIETILRDCTGKRGDGQI